MPTQRFRDNKGKPIATISDPRERQLNFYDGLDVHRLLVGDEVRTGSFYESIRATVRPGDAVLDVGAGSGILSLFGAASGARRVYAIERAHGAAALARQLVADNQLSGIIHVIEADAEAVRLPEQVDVLVSEWLGVYGVDENMLPPVVVARDRWLKPGGAVIPSVVTAWLAPVQHRAGHQATRFRDRPYGLNLSAMAPYPPHQAVWLPRPVEAGELRARPQPLWVTDCASISAREAASPKAAEVSFELEGDGVNGVVAWFSADMPGARVLSNGPGEPGTHWGQFLFPVANAASAGAGDRLVVGFHNVPASSFGSHHLWSSRVAGQPSEVHDTRWHPYAGWEPPWRAFDG